MRVKLELAAAAAAEDVTHSFASEGKFRLPSLPVVTFKFNELRASAANC